ncbi:sulfatase-like hydrolase/transferase [Halorussus marinus]|uniref:sulfatase-like hydrolase/transferase n=1 Tax=Halorussus marinus TaxID=2505976 RepID=UPI0010919751|nr:sulfatase-like hydrolase/transferase [Halorussus marinus]
MTDRRDILLLLTDQERYDVSAADGPAVDTPAMDRLAREGVRFEDAYTPIGICSSARASLLTGLYPHNHGMLNNCHEPDAIRPNLPEDHVTFGELLADAGYANSYAGKWHVGRDQRPEDFGFETLAREDTTEADGGFAAHQRAHGVDPDGIELEDEIYAEYAGEDLLVSATTPVPKEATLTYYLAEVTVDRLESAASGDEPFFHRTDFPGPHHPYVVPEPYASMYDPDEIPRWGNYAETFDGKPYVHEQHLAYRGVEGFDWETWARAISHYFGFVTFIDEQIGRVLDAMDRLGLDEDTVVVHSADHGDFTGSHRQFNKGPLMYEEVYHIPLVVRWPDAADAGRTVEEFVGLHDLMPTFCALAGVDSPSSVDGRSLVPLLTGDAPDDWRERLVAEYHGEEFGLYSQRMVRAGDYKLVYNAFDTDELYDLAEDPHELRNLVDHPDYREVYRELRSELGEWMDRTDDPIGPWTRRVLDKSADSQ